MPIARPRPQDLHTPRLILRPTTTALLRAELAGNRALATALAAVVPDGWPPGEHNLHAVRYFLENPGLLLEGWSDYYAITQAVPGTPATLVASIGFQGPPNRAGRVEVGYSVVESVAVNDPATATVVACWWDTAVLYGPAVSPGTPPLVLNDWQVTSRYESAMQLVEGRWRISRETRIERIEGVNQCPPDE